MRRYSRNLVGVILVAVLLSVTVLSGCIYEDTLEDTIYPADMEVSGNITLTNGYSFTREGGYYHTYDFDAINLTTLGTAASQINPNASSIGGYRLDAINEWLSCLAYIDDDWDGSSNGTLQIWFEVNVDNSGGADADVVRIQVEVWDKIEGELTTTVQSLEGSTTVGKATQHKLFIQEINVPNLRANALIAFRFNLNTILSDVTNIIVNEITFKYETQYPAVEVP